MAGKLLRAGLWLLLALNLGVLLFEVVRHAQGAWCLFGAAGAPAGLDLASCTALVGSASLALRWQPREPRRPVRRWQFLIAVPVLAVAIFFGAALSFMSWVYGKATIGDVSDQALMVWALANLATSVAVLVWGVRALRQRILPTTPAGRGLDRYWGQAGSRKERP